jgi:hypothetical protein
MGGQPGKPKPPGNPPTPREPERSPRVEEPPKPIPVPPVERPPAPMQVSQGETLAIDVDYASATGSISAGSLFLTLPTRLSTGHIAMSSAG